MDTAMADIRPATDGVNVHCMVRNAASIHKSWSKLHVILYVPTQPKSSLLICHVRVHNLYTHLCVHGCL